jgi:hypothetical protein
MPKLIHGTTRYRAEQIIRHGPNPNYREPGGVSANDGFSMYLDGGPFLFDPPELYAKGKAGQCPDEGDPVILIVEVPESILEAADPLGLFPLSFGVVQFDIGAGLEELLAAWHSLPKAIRDV